jgi:hypothetical protein
MLDWWLKPPVDPLVKVYVFNYTNIDSFLNGTDEKIKINEIGPYTFRDNAEKINVEFHEDAISFYVSITILLTAPAYFLLNLFFASKQPLKK